jgi:hypothetical protein
VHTAAKFSTDCKICHTTTIWTTTTFNHNTATTFPLSGGHIGVSCISCHTKGYAGISTDCVSCHLTKYNATTTPNHTTVKYPTDCKICHTSTGWAPSTFNHTTGTTFPLTGAHITVACVSCHASGYAGISTDCSSCHLLNYPTAKNPDHVAAKFPTDCKICHTTAAWTPNSFNHNNATTFPLTGSHIGVDCISCHAVGYTGISKACVSCHLNNYNASTNPGHIAAKFATTCESCHSTTAWAPSTFNHTTGTTFPLTGSHIGASCISCHSKGYAGISTACVSCHQLEYTATKNPVHTTAQFSTSCEFCHTTTVWTPSTYNHNPLFPITTGKHLKGEAWNSCTDCHTNPANYAIFACILCHEHSSITDLKDKHSSVKGYAYTSAGCFSCHPRGLKN